VGDYAVLMHYGPTGAFNGAEVLPPHEASRFRHDRDLAWTAAEAFEIWWTRHSELHRRRAA